MDFSPRGVGHKVPDMSGHIRVQEDEQHSTNLNKSPAKRRCTHLDQYWELCPTIVGQSDQNSQIRRFQSNSLREYPVIISKKAVFSFLSKSD